MRMVRNDSPAAFLNAVLDTPLPRALPRGDEVFVTPGCNVMSPGDGGDHFGILVSYGETVLVRSHGWPGEEQCVWTGSREDYDADWIVD